MDSTTAPPSSASSPLDGLADGRAQFLSLLAGLTDPSRRNESARALAARAGAEDLLLFVKDDEVDALLPAPGFPQTLPGAASWRQFLDGVIRRSPHAGKVGFRDEAADREAVGLLAPDGSVVVFVGGKLDLVMAMEISLLLPILAATFRCERVALTAEGQAAVARALAGQSKLLATSLENARRALRQALSEAEAANTAKDRFLAVLSHELRTPLAPVLTAASAMLDDPALSPETRTTLAMIQRNVELEARLIDDLLDLTRLVKGEVPLNLDTIDAHASLHQTVAICRTDIYAKKLDLSLALEAREHHIRADPARLQQIFWNLVKNAVKFTPQGGRLTVRSRNEDGWLRVEIEDSGIGIEPHSLDTIFNAFEQADEAVTQRFGGLGLGLAIAKALVQAHGGQITAVSRGRGKGAIFTISLPIVHLPAGTAIPHPSHREAESARKLKLLLVEDHPDTAAVMLRLLRSLGHEVVAANTIAQAELAAAAAPFDLVLSDLGLPDGNGLDLMRRLHAAHGLSGIAITGYGMEADVRQTQEVGFIAHMTKPINFDRLKAVLVQFAASGTRPPPPISVTPSVFRR